MVFVGRGLGLLRHSASGCIRGTPADETASMRMHEGILRIGVASSTDEFVKTPFRSCGAWYRDRWVDVGALDGDYDAWLRQ